MLLPPNKPPVLGDTRGRHPPGTTEHKHGRALAFLHKAVVAFTPGAAGLDLPVCRACGPSGWEAQGDGDSRTESQRLWRSECSAGSVTLGAADGVFLDRGAEKREQVQEPLGAFSLSAEGEEERASVRNRISGHRGGLLAGPGGTHLAGSRCRAGHGAAHVPQTQVALGVPVVKSLGLPPRSKPKQAWGWRVTSKS